MNTKIQYTKSHNNPPRSYKSFSHFLTNVCAILGGIYAFAGMVDNFLYRTTSALNRKNHELVGGRF